MLGTGRCCPTKVGRRARTERTRNMLDMPVTLDVLKLSGWLKAASCRVEKEGIRSKARVRAQGKARLDIGCRARTVRT